MFSPIPNGFIAVNTVRNFCLYKCIKQTTVIVARAKIVMLFFPHLIQMLANNEKICTLASQFIDSSQTFSPYVTDPNLRTMALTLVLDPATMNILELFLL